MANETLIPGRGRFITSTDGLQSGQFYALQPVGGTAQISAITLAPGYTGANRLTPLTLQEGGLINVRFTAITVSSGALVVYEAE